MSKNLNVQNNLSNQIYSLIDDVNSRLNKISTNPNFDNNIYPINNTLNINNNIDKNNIQFFNPNLNQKSNLYLAIPKNSFVVPNKNINNVIYDNNNNINSSNEYYLKKLIKDEFSTLILPYQHDMHNNINILERKISNLSLPNLNNLNYIPSNNNNNNNNNFNFNSKDYVLKAEYDNKILELTKQLNNLNNYLNNKIENQNNNNNNNFNNNLNNNNEILNEINTNYVKKMILIIN